MYGNVKSIDIFDKEPLHMVRCHKTIMKLLYWSHQNDYYFAMMPEKMIGLECTVRGGNTMSLMTDSKVKIVGIAYKDSG